MTPTTQQILNAAAYLTGEHPAVAAMLRQIAEMPGHELVNPGGESRHKTAETRINTGLTGGGQAILSQHHDVAWVDAQLRKNAAVAVFNALRAAVPTLGPWSAFDADEVQSMADALKPYLPTRPLVVEHVGVTSDQRQLIEVIADKIEDGTLFQAGIYSRKDIARFVRNMLDTQPPAAAPTDFELSKCWVQKPNGEIDGIASMRAVLKKFTISQHQATEENADGVHARPQTVVSTKLSDLRASLDFYKRRADELQKAQSKMRDPERTMVCDILASGTLLVPAGGRYSAPTQQAAEPVDGALDRTLKERDDAEDFIDALLDEVLGGSRPEWSSAYGRSDALNDVRERLAQQTAEPVACAFPERDHTRPAEQQGLFRKFIVQRVDGGDRPGGKHHGCEYFVLDMDHDAHAPDALRAYAESCKDTHPQLSADLLNRFGPAPTQQPDEISPEFTDTARAALLWVLWHHQGGSSPVGQPIRYALGMGSHDDMSDAQIREAKRWDSLRPKPTHGITGSKT
jgi:hypothetical protein